MKFRGLPTPAKSYVHTPLLYKDGLIDDSPPSDRSGLIPNPLRSLSYPSRLDSGF